MSKGLARPFCRDDSAPGYRWNGRIAASMLSAGRPPGQQVLPAELVIRARRTAACSIAGGRPLTATIR
jgi:hypothetical protein